MKLVEAEVASRQFPCVRGKDLHWNFERRIECQERLLSKPAPAVATVMHTNPVVDQPAA